LVLVAGSRPYRTGGKAKEGYRPFFLLGDLYEMVLEGGRSSLHNPRHVDVGARPSTQALPARVLCALQHRTSEHRNLLGYNWRSLLVRYIEVNAYPFLVPGAL